MPWRGQERKEKKGEDSIAVAPRASTERKKKKRKRRGKGNRIPMQRDAGRGAARHKGRRERKKASYSLFRVGGGREIGKERNGGISKGEIRKGRIPSSPR